MRRSPRLINYPAKRKQSEGSVIGKPVENITNEISPKIPVKKGGTNLKSGDNVKLTIAKSKTRIAAEIEFERQLRDSFLVHGSTLSPSLQPVSKIDIQMTPKLKRVAKNSILSPPCTNDVQQKTGQYIPTAKGNHSIFYAIFDCKTKCTQLSPEKPCTSKSGELNGLRITEINLLGTISKRDTVFPSQNESDVHYKPTDMINIDTPEGKAVVIGFMRDGALTSVADFKRFIEILKLLQSVALDAQTSFAVVVDFAKKLRFISETRQACFERRVAILEKLQET